MFEFRDLGADSVLSLTFVREEGWPAEGVMP
jgi:hypothetical protein